MPVTCYAFRDDKKECWLIKRCLLIHFRIGFLKLLVVHKKLALIEWKVLQLGNLEKKIKDLRRKSKKFRNFQEKTKNRLNLILLTD